MTTSIGYYTDEFRAHILARLKKPRLCIKKAQILTEAYRETEGEPMVIRMAKALHKVTNEMPIWIADWQIIVGGLASEPFAVPFCPDGSWKWIVEELDTLDKREGDKYELGDEDKAALFNLIEYWKGHSIEDAVMARLPEEAKEAYLGGLISSGYVTTRSGNFILDFEKVINEGLEKIADYAKSRMAALDLSRVEDYKKWLYYQAVLISCDAAIDFAERYAKLAEDMARSATDGVRRRELLTISEACRRVPRYPARNFHEALQSFWFIHVLAHYETGATGGMSVGRLDQYLYPYYKKDIESGIITRSEAARLVADYFINQNQIMMAHDKRRASIFAGHPLSEQPTLCGTTPAGEDATNDLSILLLEVDRELRLPQPDIAVMWHPHIDEEVLNKACETLPRTMKPKFFNLRIAREHARLKGAMPEDIRTNLANVGCVSSVIGGKTWGNNNMVFINLGKVLELAIHGGEDPLTGKRIGAVTPRLLEASNWEEFLQGFKSQVSHAIKLGVMLANVVELVHSELSPQPFASMLIDDHLEHGEPAWSGAARYNMPGVEGVGLGTLADSLAAIKKVIFEDRKVNREELVKALNANFADPYGRVRHILVEEAPKFGNDEEYVDAIAAEVAAYFCNEVSKHSGPRGVKYAPALYSVSAHVGLGQYVGATPDGRGRAEPLSDGMSPAQGVCKKGPTAVIKSVARVNHALATSGTLLNMKLNAGLFRTQEGKDKFKAMLRAFMELGGYHVQFNIVDTEVLKEAQLHPEKYPDLLVRVAAYVAQFTQLPREVQDDIIARSEL